MRRRDFITLLGSAAAAWPLAARAQQAALPVVGWLGAGSPEVFATAIVAFSKGVSELGFLEGRDVSFEYRWAEGQYDRLPTLAAELVRRPVAAILASGGNLPTRAAQAASSTIPIVFTINTDPVAAGLVASLNRPGRNVTGVNFFSDDAITKQLGLLHAAVPAAAVAGALLNPTGARFDAVVQELQTATRSLGMDLRVLRASTERDIDEVFASFTRQNVHALIVQSDPFLFSRHDQILALAAKRAIPTISGGSDWPAAGGLMSYGAKRDDAYHQAGQYVGRILKGEKPADLPVVQSTTFELVINLKTAKALGLDVPPTLLAIADDVIE
jgi:putative ABC transport system substrate-binding protein